MALPRSDSGRRVQSRDARAIAQALLEELRGPPPQPPPPPPVPAWRTASSKTIAEARLLLLLSRGNAPLKNQKYRCNKCDDCLAGDCGECASCLDKPKFGGRGLRKQACLTRRCVHLGTRKRVSV